MSARSATNSELIISRPWEVTVAQVQTKEISVRLPRPNTDDGSVKPETTVDEDAEQIEHHHKESRRRIRKLQDGGVVIEEQEQRFVDRRITWSAQGKKGEEKVKAPKAEQAMVGES